TSVAVIGFSAQERNVLKNVFDLTSLRSPSFAQFDPETGGAPDLFLVDASNEASMKKTLGFVAAHRVPVVLVGDSTFGTPYPALRRPIRWAQLLKLLDTSVASTEPSSAGARKADVLVVDDSLAVRKFMELKLEPYSIGVDFAESGEKAIELAAERHYTCVFLDVML